MLSKKVYSVSRAVSLNKENSEYQECPASSKKQSSGTLNHKIYNSTALIEKDPNTATENRLRLIIQSKEQMQRAYEQQEKRQQQEITKMRKRIHELEDSLVMLEKYKIQQEEEVNFMSKKLKHAAQKQKVLQAHIDMLTREKQNKTAVSCVSEFQEESVCTMKKSTTEIFSKVSINTQQPVNATQPQLCRELQQLKQKYNQSQSLCQILHVKVKDLQEIITNLEAEKQMEEPQEGQQKWMEGQIEELRVLWSNDQKRLQMQISYLKRSEEQAKQQLAMYIGKTEVRMKIQAEDIEFKNKKIEKLETDLQKEGECTKILVNKLQQDKIVQERLMKDIQKQTKKIETMQANFTQLNEECTVLKSQLKLKRRQLEQKQSLNRQYKRKIQEYTRLHDQSQEMVAQLQQSNHKWQGQYKGMVEARDILQNQLRETKMNVGRQQRVDVQIQMINQVQIQLTKALQLETNKNKQLKELATCLTEKANSAAGEAEKYFNTLQDLTQQYQLYQNQIEERRVCIEKVHSREIQELNNIIQCLEKQVQKWKDYRNEHSDQHQEMRRENRKLKNQLEESEQQLKKCKSKIKDYEDKWQKEELAHKQDRNKKQTLQSKITQQKERKIIEQASEITQLQQQMEKERKRVKQIQSKLKCLIKQKQRQTFQLAEAQKEQNQLHQQLKDALQKTKSEWKAQKWEIQKDHENKVQIYEANNRKLSEEAHNLAKTVSQMEEQIWQMQQKLKNKQRLICKLEIQRNTLEAQLAEANKINIACNIKTQVQKMSGLLTRKSEENAVLCVTVSTLQKQINLLNKASREYQDQLASKKFTVQALNKQNNQLKIELRLLRQEIDVLTQKLMSQSAEKQRVLKSGQKLKDKVSNQERKRMTIYYRIATHSKDLTAYFPQEHCQLEHQFLVGLQKQIQSWLDTSTLLKIQNQTYKKSARESLQTNLTRQLINSTKIQNSKNQQTIELQQNYASLYQKYKKYKKGFLTYKEELDKYRREAINDQRYTQRIISDCKALIQKK